MLNYLLAIADVWHWGFYKVPLIAAAARGQVIAAAVGLLGGFAGLLTFSINYHQKKDHFERQRAQERAQSDYDAIAAEYDALSKDFVAEKELARINAAIGLASIALRPDPKRLFEESLSPDAAPKTSTYYPWYERIASQLVAALHIYQEPRARAQVRSAIRRLATIDDSKGQPLLHFLIHQLADANRTAYQTFIETLADITSSKKDLTLRQLARSITVFDKSSRNFRCLRELIRSEKFTLSQRSKLDSVIVQESFKDDDYKNQAMTLRLLRISSEQLTDTRDAISDCLNRGIRKVKWTNIELSPLSDEDIRSSEYISDFSDSLATALLGTSELILSGTFLQGIKFRGAQLQFADFSYAQLQYSSFDSVNMQFGNFDYCSLKNANFVQSNLQCVSAHGSQLSRSQFSRVNLQCSNFDRSDLAHAKIRDCNFDAVSMRAAKLTNSLIESSDLRAVILAFAHLKGVEFICCDLTGTVMFSITGLDTNTPPIFRNSETSKLDFCLHVPDRNELIRTGQVDGKARAWFRSLTDT